VELSEYNERAKDYKNNIMRIKHFSKYKKRKHNSNLEVSQKFAYLFGHYRIEKEIPCCYIHVAIGTNFLPLQSAVMFWSNGHNEKHN